MRKRYRVTDTTVYCCRYHVINIVGKFYENQILNREFPELPRKLPTLWTRSKFIATVGSVSLEVVNKYIEEQKSNEQRRKK